MRKHIISRVVAILALSFPLGWAVIFVQEQDVHVMETLAYNELLVYFRAEQINFYEAIIGTFCIGLLYIGFMEAIAYSHKMGLAEICEKECS